MFCLLPFSVPSAPQNLAFANVLANQFTLVWDPPFIPNGIIQSYVVLVQATQTLNQLPDSFFQVREFAVLDSPLNISAIPYTVFVVNVLAVTSAGVGNASAASVLTAEAREFVCNLNSAGDGINATKMLSRLTIHYIVVRVYMEL